MGKIDDYKRRENIKRMEKLIEYLLCVLLGKIPYGLAN
jgi:hypothetical protein